LLKGRRHDLPLAEEEASAVAKASLKGLVRLAMTLTTVGGSRGMKSFSVPGTS
jgi:hypothetical protein